MNSTRRSFSIDRRRGARGGAAALLPGARAATWNKSGFEAKAAGDVIKNLGAAPDESKDIAITAPDIAENGAVVPVAVTSRIPNTQLDFVAEKNPFPLAATFDVSKGASPHALRMKMGQTSNVRAWS